MPSRDLLCYDCRVNEAATEIRKRHLCQGCFHKYVGSKILKRMETYRFRNQTQIEGKAGRKRLLLPVSGGVSSLVLLEVLDKQIRKQLCQQGRTAYDLVICHVDAAEYAAGTGSSGTDLGWYQTLREKVGENHHFLPVIPFHELLDYEQGMEQDLVHLDLNRADSEDGRNFMHRIMATTRTATARSDITTILLRRLLVAIAKHNDCTSILWGHSDSTLAALTLASVAKGRGGAVSSDLSDGPSSCAGLNFNYPLRDLFETELRLYFDGLPHLQDCLAPQLTADGPVSLRATSIDSLMSTYMLGQGEKYPSIMANVVKTAGKLQTPTLSDSHCRFCMAPVPTNHDGPLCYGCERMKQDIKP